MPPSIPPAIRDDVRFHARVPTLAEFKALSSDAGWGRPSDEAMAKGLSRTLFAVCAETPDGATIGMGRVVGDGGVQFFITDVIVAKAWQRRGIGKAIMARLTEYIRAKAEPRSFVGLFSALDRHAFYESFGFVVRPNARLGPGMVYFFASPEV